MGNTQRRKLTDTDVEAIRFRYLGGATMQGLSEDFGVSKTTIHRVVNGICYREVTGLSPAALDIRYRESRAGNGRQGAAVTNRRRFRSGEQC